MLVIWGELLPHVASHNLNINRKRFRLHIRLGLFALLWRHNGCDGVSNNQPHDCLLNRLFRRRSKKTSKLHVTSLCGGNSPVTSEFPAKMANNAENVTIWWRHHGQRGCCSCHVCLLVQNVLFSRSHDRFDTRSFSVYQINPQSLHGCWITALVPG